jgi:hypothetical protein
LRSATASTARCMESSVTVDPSIECQSMISCLLMFLFMWIPHGLENGISYENV